MSVPLLRFRWNANVAVGQAMVRNLSYAKSVHFSLIKAYLIADISYKLIWIGNVSDHKLFIIFIYYSSGITDKLDSGLEGNISSDHLNNNYYRA